MLLLLVSRTCFLIHRAQHSCWCSWGRCCTGFAVGNYCWLKTLPY